jgi:MerR family transcriptional regulator, copper efflux regulator
MATRLPIIACSLNGTNQRERLAEWKSLLAVAELREELPNGRRFRFGPSFAERVRSLAEAEQECCSFLRLDVAEANDGVVLTVETEPSGQEALRFIFG